MKCVVLLLLTVLTFRVGSSPTPHENQPYSAFKNVYDYEDDANEDNNHQILKKSIEINRPFSENHVKSEENFEDEEPCRINFPNLKDLSAELSQDIFKDDGLPDLSYPYPMGMFPPRVPSYPYHVPYEKWTKYDVDYSSQDPMDYRNIYNSYNIPYMYNPMPPVRSLPPVMTTRIRENISPMTENANDIDADNEMHFPPYVRAVRSRDYLDLDQLREDAVMPNIIPAMPFPYMRNAIPSFLPSAQYYHSQPSSSYDQSGPVAYFPSAPHSDCAVPLLVSCSPQISYGSLRNVDSGEAGPSVPSAPSVPTYRKESVTEIDPSKVPLVSQ